MTVLGVPNEWVDLIEDKLPELLQLVVGSWPLLARPFADIREDPITFALCKELRKNKHLRGLCFYIDTQLIELDTGPNLELSRLDIVFRPSGGGGPPDEDIYLCLECKRLNIVTSGRVQSRASEYVTEGMLRFVKGQYSKTVGHGAMVGYVLDNNVANALSSVEGVVQTRYVELLMDAPGALLPSTACTFATARESIHHRTSETAPFRMHHLFVAAGRP